VDDDIVARALNLLVQSSRVSPPLREAVRVVDAEIARLRDENEALQALYEQRRDLLRSCDTEVRRLRALLATVTPKEDTMHLPGSHPIPGVDVTGTYPATPKEAES
jgi:hypothetical protein